jgi:hypothetical protein
MERDQCVRLLAATLREATAALAILDLWHVEHCTLVQTELCERLSFLNLTLRSHPEAKPLDPSLGSELSLALRTCRSVLRGSALWVKMNHNTLQLAFGMPEYTASRSHSMSY